MNRISSFLQDKIVPATSKFANISFMVILRNAVMSIIPLMVVGAIGTFMTNIPFEGIAKFVEPTNTFFNTLSLVTANLSGLVIAIAIGYYGAQHYHIDLISGMVASTVSFIAATLTPELTINAELFGATGMFTAIIVGFISIFILHLCKKYKIEIRMPDNVPSMVATSFSSIIALAIATSFILILRIGLGLDINSAITNLFSPLSNSLNTLPGFLTYSLLASTLFICGINPTVIFGLLFPILAMNGQANSLAVSQGQLPTAHVTWGMWTLMSYGGTGATIGLAIMLLFSKSKAQKTLGKLSIFPSFFNINEPIVYGLPIIFNPIMIIPFILVPIINISSTWLLMEWNIIGRAFVDIPWTTPPVISGFLMSGGDLRTALWTGILVLISAVCYYPFFKIMEHQAVNEENNLQEERSV